MNALLSQVHVEARLISEVFLRRPAMQGPFPPDAFLPGVNSQSVSFLRDKVRLNPAVLILTSPSRLLDCFCLQAVVSIVSPKET